MKTIKHWLTTPPKQPLPKFVESLLYGTLTMVLVIFINLLMLDALLAESALRGF